MKVVERFGNRKVDEKNEIGLEIEMEGPNLFYMDLPNYWKEEEDGSLRGHSMEYVLRRPVLRKDVAKVLDYLNDNFKKNQFKLLPSDRCGVHVHINCQQMEEAEVFNFLTLYFILEEVLTKYCGEDREGNLFCLRAADAEWLLEQLYQAKMWGTFGNVAVDNLRYAAVNVCALNKFGSLEFRALRTPADVTKIGTWVELLTAVKDASLNFKSGKQMIEAVSKRGPMNFLRDIFKDEVRHLQFRGVENILLESARKAQPLAYAKFGSLAKKREAGIKKKAMKMNVGQQGQGQGFVGADPWGVVHEGAPMPDNPQPVDRQARQRAEQQAFNDWMDQQILAINQAQAAGRGDR